MKDETDVEAEIPAENTPVEISEREVVDKSKAQAQETQPSTAEAKLVVNQ